MKVRRGREPKRDGKAKADLPEWGAEDGCGDDGEVRQVGNHIYYHAPITTKPVALLIDSLHTTANRQRVQAVENGGDPQPIVLHLSSPGGSVLAGAAAMDAVRLCPVPVHVVVDGYCASAATFPLMVAAKRIIQRNAYVLIHQLSSVHWGKYSELQDDMENSTEFMRLIRRVYLKHTRIKRRRLDRILKHDLWFPARKCLKLGLVDEIV
jgi:ATP-dependent protease ClpP protease subunit